MTELLGMGLVKHCECFETINAIHHQSMLENFDVKTPHVFGPGGSRAVRRVPNGQEDSKPQGRHCMARIRDAEPEKF